MEETKMNGKKVLGELNYGQSGANFARGSNFPKRKKRRRRNARKLRSPTNIPTEVWVRIFAFCDVLTLTNLKLTCTHFYNIIEYSMPDKYGHSNLTMDSMPSEIILAIFAFLDRQDVARCAQVCKRFCDLSSTNCLWSSEAKQCLGTNAIDVEMKKRSVNPDMTAQDRIRISRNWTRGRYGEVQLMIQNTRYMPRVQLTSLTLWVSWGSQIWAHHRKANGTIRRTAAKVLRGHTDDVSRFVVKDGVVVSGGRDKTLAGWRIESGNRNPYEFAFARRYCHGSDISAVDVTSRGSVIISGSRDNTVKLWHFSDSDNALSLAKTLHIGDRIWSLATSKDGSLVAVGSAGLAGVPSLNLVDVMSGNPVLQLGRNLRHGAGMLDVSWIDNANFLSCGYDSFARLWDTRSAACVRKWEEPFNEVVYCLSTDNNMTLVCGNSRHGLVRLWDMRSSMPVQYFYVKHPHIGESSPVYSVAFDESNLYVALDQSLNLLSFNGRDNNKNQKLCKYLC